MDRVEACRGNTRRLVCKIANINKERCRCGDISKVQCFLIVEIGRQPEISLLELAYKVESDKGLVSRTVDDLVNKDYAERKQGTKDRREIVLKLTIKGVIKFKDIECSMN